MQIKSGSSIPRKLSLQLLAVVFLDSVFVDTCIYFKWFGANFSFTWICNTYHLSKVHIQWSQFPSLLFARMGIRNFDDLVKSLTQEIKPNNKTK